MSETATVLPKELFRSGTFGVERLLADPRLLKTLASLPGTSPELDRMRVALGAPPSTVHVRQEATEANIKAMDLSVVDVLALATHGLMAGELTGEAEPGLVLTPPEQPNNVDDGYLSASDIAELRLNADWVILSACNTASGDGKAGSSGLSGLARAFFYAGARSLLVSHWPVRDDVAPELTVNSLRFYRQGTSKAVALQKAMHSVRMDVADPTRAHPFSWAPFTIVGDGK